VIIECPMSGVPEPTVTWTINESPLIPKDRIHLTDRNRKLTIDQAQVADTATYMCVAENKAGELRKKFHLEVLGKWNISIHSQKNLNALSPSCIALSFDRFGSTSWHSIWFFFRLLYSFHIFSFGFPIFFGLSTTEET
jgi:hypothetical protein